MTACRTGPVQGLQQKTPDALLQAKGSKLGLKELESSRGTGGVWKNRRDYRAGGPGTGLRMGLL